MTDPHNPGKIGVTIKVPESKKYAGDNPWFVFEGTDPEAVKAKIGATFGINTKGLSLADVVVEAQRLVTSLGAVAHGLGGRPLPQSAPGTPEAPEGDVWAQAAAAVGGVQAPAEDPILVQIERATSRAELQQIWAENQAAFADDKYMVPYKAKGKSLS